MIGNPQPPKVLCAGSIVLDTIVRSVEEFRWGTTTPVEDIVRHIGGNGANTARALELLGIEVDLAGAVGHDEAAGFIVSALEKTSICLNNVARVDRPTAASIVLVNARGDRQFLHRFGASDLAFESLTRAQAMLSEGTYEHFHLASLYALPHLRKHAAEILPHAKALGLSTSLDVNWDSRGEWLSVLEPCLPFVDLLFLNEDESRMITGLPGASDAAAFLKERGAACVIQKLGELGCGVFSRDEQPRMCTAFDVNAIDSTGAGDCFAAGFLSGYLKRNTMRQCGDRGNAAGAMSVSSVGAVAGLESMSEIENWIHVTPRRVLNTQ